MQNYQFLWEVDMETEETEQQKTLAAFEANGWEIAEYRGGAVLMKKIDTSPNGRESTLRAQVDGGGSSVIV